MGATQISNLTFSDALDLLKDGERLARDNWNAKNQYIYHVPAANYPAATDIALQEFGTQVPYGAYIAIKTVQNNVVPWLASQTDLLAEDWAIYVPETK